MYVFKIMHLLIRNLPRKPNNLVSEEPRQNKGRGLVDRKLVEAPQPPPPRNFNAGRPKAALLFWFFGEFKWGVLLFMVILVRCLGWDLGLDWVSF